MAQFDVVVVGLGVMGSAALHRACAPRRSRRSASSALRPVMTAAPRTAKRRIIRLGYFEHPSYVPLLRRTYALWRELEAASGAKLLHITGIAEIGPPDGELVTGTLAASRLHGLPHEVLDAAETMRRFPAFHIPTDYVGVFQPDGGFVAVEAGASRRMLAQAQAAGAEIQTSATVLSIAPHGAACASRPAQGEIDARIAIVAAGPGSRQLLPDLPAPLRVTRAGHGLVRAARPGAVRDRTLPGVPARKPPRHALRLSAVRPRRGQDRQAPPPRRNRRSRRVRPHGVGRPTKR